MPREFDLDASKRARAEQRGDPPAIVFGGRRFPLVTELPVEFVEDIVAYHGGDYLRLKAAISKAFPDQDSAGEFFAMQPSWEDLILLSDSITAMLLGVSQGESSASGSSSKRGSGSSRRSSKSATA